MVSIFIFCFGLIFFSLTANVNSQTCHNMGSLDPCSYNHACKCLPLSFADDVGICAVVGASCSRLSPCRFPHDTCDADHICVRHRQCGSNPVCYPLSMADQRLCPLMITTPTSTYPGTTGITYPGTTTTTYPRTTATTYSTTTRFLDTTEYPTWEMTGFPENSVISNYSSALTFSSERYLSSNKYYEAIEVIVYITGTYSFTSSSSMDTFGYLYTGMFDPSNLNLNMLTSNDDYPGSNQFKLIAHLEAGVSYTLVVTTYGPDVRGPFTIIARGPTYVDFFPRNFTDTTMIMPSGTETTSEEPVEFEQSTNYPDMTQYPDWEMTGFPENSVISNYSSALTFSSERYLSSNKYYEAIEVIVYITGTYSFTSSSSMDTFGYLYAGIFDPSNQNLNTLKSDDDSADNNQFRLIAYLVAGVSYTLVVTTFGSDVTGPFAIIARGPTYVDFFPRNFTDTTMIMSSATTTIATSYEATAEFQQSTDYPDWEMTRFPEGSISTSYSSALTLNSERNPSAGKYYKEISIITYTAGTYSFTSSSNMDTFGYLYTGIFYPSDPNLNLVTSNDDYPGSNQFRLIAHLEAGVSYKLVVTTFSRDTTGPFSITTLGPDSVNFSS